MMASRLMVYLGDRLDPKQAVRDRQKKSADNWIAALQRQLHPLKKQEEWLRTVLGDETRQASGGVFTNKDCSCMRTWPKPRAAAVETRQKAAEEELARLVEECWKLERRVSTLETVDRSSDLCVATNITSTRSCGHAQGAGATPGDVTWPAMRS